MLGSAFIDHEFNFYFLGFETWTSSPWIRKISPYVPRLRSWFYILGYEIGSYLLRLDTEVNYTLHNYAKGTKKGTHLYKCANAHINFMNPIVKIYASKTNNKDGLHCIHEDIKSRQMIFIPNWWHKYNMSSKPKGCFFIYYLLSLLGVILNQL